MSCSFFRSPSEKTNNKKKEQYRYDSIHPFVPESISVFRALDKIRGGRSHMALVVDEFGGIEGLVTLTDLVEEIIGDIPTNDITEPRAVRRDDGSWLMSGSLPIDDFKEHLGIEHLPEEKVLVMSIPPAPSASAKE